MCIGTHHLKKKPGKNQEKTRIKEGKKEEERGWKKVREEGRREGRGGEGMVLTNDSNAYATTTVALGTEKKERKKIKKGGGEEREIEKREKRREKRERYVPYSKPPQR